MLFEVKGSRTNISEMVNLLTAKISELLKASGRAQGWNASDEATQYFEEAKWALKWGLLPEAQMASDSSWALAKRDLDCARLRVQSYLPEILSGVHDFENSSLTVSEGADLNEIRREIERVRHTRAGAVFSLDGATLNYIALEKAPEPKAIDRALKPLTLYEELSHELAEELKSSRDKGEEAAGAWFALGVDDLTAAAKVLERYQFVPGSEQPVAKKLAELRERARSVDQLISDVSLIRNHYYLTEGALPKYSDVTRYVSDGKNVLQCEVEWGCFWQETPEDCLSLYRDLLKSPAFCLIHRSFWTRPPQQPRITAWNERDRRRLPEVWAGFLQELNQSTNLLWRMEARALTFAVAPTQAEQGTAFTNLFNLISENNDELMTYPFPLFDHQWGLDRLFERGPFHSLYVSSYRAKLEAFEEAYAFNSIPGMNEQLLFPQQKRYLETNTTYEFSEIARLFYHPRSFTKSQARELQPLIAGYKTNLFARSQVSSGEWTRLRQVMDMVAHGENTINRVIDPSVPLRSSSKDLPPRPKTLAQSNSPSTNVVQGGSPPISRPAILTSSPPLEVNHKPAKVAPTSLPEPAVVANIVVANKFSEIPSMDSTDTGPATRMEILAHHWNEGKLLLDFESLGPLKLRVINENSPEANNFKAYGTPSGLAVFDPANGHWEVAALSPGRVGGGKQILSSERSAERRTLSCGRRKDPKVQLPNSRVGGSAGFRREQLRII